MVKVDAANFTYESSVNLTTATNVKTLIIDSSGNTSYLYAGTTQSPAVVAKIDLDTFQQVATWTAAAGENNFQTVELDTTLGMLYYG